MLQYGAVPHCASLVQTVKQPPDALHAKPLQETAVCALQVPAPSHEDARSSVPPAQLAAAQVVVGKLQDELLPAHVPWQTAAPAHAARDPCGCPEGTSEQDPCLPATSHAWQLPVQAVSQQKWSMQ